jgi:hypothetical protein
MAPIKSPAQVMAEQRARHSISQRDLDKIAELEGPAERPVDGTFLHRGDEALAEAVIKQQHAEQAEADRELMFKEVSVSEVLDEVR